MRRYVSLFLLLATAIFCSAQPGKHDEQQKATAAFRAGLVAQQNGNLEKAREQFARCVQLAPSIAESHEALGVVLIEMNLNLSGLDELEKAYSLKPKDAGIHLNLATAYLNVGNSASAIKYFQLSEQELAANQSALNANFYENYAKAFERERKIDSALTKMLIAASLEPDRSSLQDELGALLAQAGHNEDARDHFLSALRLDANNLSAMLHLGAIYLTLNQPAKAVEILEQALALKPNFAPALFEEGQACVNLQQDAKAESLFKSAIDLDPNIPDLKNQYAMVLQREGRNKDAIPFFEEALTADPANVSILANLGLALTQVGKAKEAIPYILKALASEPRYLDALEDLGVAQVQQSEFDAAIDTYKRAVEVAPLDSQVHYDLGLVYKFKDRTDDAITELKRAAELDPQLPDPPYTLGILYMQIGQLDDAAKQYQKAVELRPDNGDVWAVYGSVLKQLSRFEDAIPVLKKALDLLPAQPGPRLTLAGVYAQQAMKLYDSLQDVKDPALLEQDRQHIAALRAEAASLRKTAADLTRAATNRQKSNFALNAGNQLLQRNAISDAVARYEEAIAADATNPDAHSQLAIAYERQGRTKEAADERATADQLRTAQKPESPK